MRNIIFLVVLFLVYGYFTNVYRLVKLDFESPYKAETIRTIGVAIPPVGMFLGYINIEDKKVK